MRDAGEKIAVGSGLALAGVQFFFTLGWVVYVIYLPGLLKGAGLAASWLPWLLMADQLIFALMDIAFGLMADRMANAYHKLARLLLLLTTVSAIAFLLLPQLGESSSGILLFLLAVWVVSASVVRAPTLVLLAKRAKAAQQAHLVIWYSAGMALAMALSPFVGLTLKGVDPRVGIRIAACRLVADACCAGCRTSD
jgi:MFS family permease